MNTRNKLKLLLPVILLIPSIIYCFPASAHDYKNRAGFSTGTSKGHYIASRYRDRGHYRKSNRNRINFTISYGYRPHYRGSYVGFGYNYPLSYHRGHDHWRYDNRRYFSRRYNDSDQLIATATGVFTGALIGSEIGRYLDDVDRLRARNANVTARSAPVGQRINWNNPLTRHYGSTTATRDGYSESGKYCREFYQTISIGNRTGEGYGVACRQPDGTWRITQAVE